MIAIKMVFKNVTKLKSGLWYVKQHQNTRDKGNVIISWVLKYVTQSEEKQSFKFFRYSNT
jgi:hypothetical protein